jgi:hypothetical protein
MENPIIEIKQELIEWVKNTNDLEELSELMKLKEMYALIPLVAESQTEYLAKDDFDERFEKGIPHKEMKRRTLKYIESLPWKK